MSNRDDILEKLGDDYDPRKATEEGLKRALELDDPSVLESVPLSQLIDAALMYRDDKKELERQAKIPGAKFDILQDAILNKMEAQGEDGIPLMKAGGLLATVSYQEDDVPTATDWGAIGRYIVDNDAAHILQKRLSASSVNEILAMQEDLSDEEEKELTEDERKERLYGVEIYRKRKLNLRKV